MTKTNEPSWNPDEVLDATRREVAGREEWTVTTGRGTWGWTWSRDGSRRVQVFVPAGDDE